LGVFVTKIECVPPVPKIRGGGFPLNEPFNGEEHHKKTVF